MAAVTVRLPALLAQIAGVKALAVDAVTPGDALRLLIEHHPGLGVLIYDETGHLREHVLCYHNDDDTRWHDDGLNRALEDRDTLTIVQAVAGG